MTSKTRTAVAADGDDSGAVRAERHRVHRAVVVAAPVPLALLPGQIWTLIKLLIRVGTRRPRGRYLDLG